MTDPNRLGTTLHCLPSLLTDLSQSDFTFSDGKVKPRLSLIWLVTPRWRRLPLSTKVSFTRIHMGHSSGPAPWMPSISAILSSNPAEM
ncbi:hypothetical protein GYMLUDRAFT_40986, partial [Collybiopsis luxurians FD-317 M1]